jgi:hypothetical protein
MQKHDARGLATTTKDGRVLDIFEQALDKAMSFAADPLALIDTALEADPEFVMGHCFRATLNALAMERHLLPEISRSVEAAEALKPKANARERSHIAAVRAWCDGDLGKAVSAWESVLLDHPRDLLAIFGAHQTDFYLGDPVQMRDRISRVMRAWDETLPGYGYVLGIHAFGLEECAHYRRAEEAGRKAVALNPDDVYAVHAVAHVMEMQGRQRDGIEWMMGRADHWAQPNGMTIHCWWHTTLYHLELGEIDRVLDLYDNRIYNKNSDISLEELDAAALLWRLNLLNVDVGDRWQELADKWEPSAEDTYYAFNDMHAMMTFAGANRDFAAAKLLGACASYVTERQGTNARMTSAVGIPVCRAILAFARGDYGSAVDLLLPVRYHSHTFGGSYAQRDVIAQTLIEASLRCGRYNLAHALLAERLALKPTSPLTWQTLARALQGLDEGKAAAEAQDKAAKLAAA